MVTLSDKLDALAEQEKVDKKEPTKKKEVKLNVVKPAEADTKPTEADNKPAEADTKPTEADTKPTEADNKPTEASNLHDDAVHPM